jgi:type I restriction enzyme R subunit
MNEADTRAELIDVALKKAGWGITPDSKIKCEHYITAERIILRDFAFRG